MKIIQIIKAGDSTIYGLAEDGSVWRASTYYSSINLSWEGPVVLSELKKS